MDIATVNSESIGGSKHWIMFVDDWSKYKWSYFVGRKSDLHERGINYISEMEKDADMKIKVIRCDNSGENM